jgi:hypothetical protein
VRELELSPALAQGAGRKPAQTDGRAAERGAARVREGRRSESRGVAIMGRAGGKDGRVGGRWVERRLKVRLGATTRAGADRRPESVR